MENDARQQESGSPAWLRLSSLGDLLAVARPSMIYIIGGQLGLPTSRTTPTLFWEIAVLRLILGREERRPSTHALMTLKELCNILCVLEVYFAVVSVSASNSLTVVKLPFPVASPHYILCKAAAVTSESQALSCQGSNASL
eukprot:scaffold447380_cov36-Prasinocladus_malaysianus.AAC.1